eukprot:scaffold171529_cov63-Cyclotella_meneghiniana.AAC.1
MSMKRCSRRMYRSEREDKQPTILRRLKELMNFPYCYETSQNFAGPIGNLANINHAYARHDNGGCISFNNQPTMGGCVHTVRLVG